ncbi:MAG: DUF3027 domain-containing protein [Jatrophihabitantaceae bacterium]
MTLPDPAGCDNGGVSAPTEQQAVDPVIAGAVDQARAAAVEMAGTQVGEHLSVRSEGALAATHAFAAALPGYQGWYWAVTMVRAPDCQPTVAEVVLLPGDGALLAQTWVPWSERLQPGDLSPGDLLPTAPDDPRLVPGYLASDDPQVEEIAFELGLGRIRVLSRYGRQDAAERWYAGEQGPDTAMAKQAPASCGSCGFFVTLGGSLSAAFGVCANEIANADGRVVSVEFGCGAHSETVAEPAVDELGEVYEDEMFDIVASEPAGDNPAADEPGTDEPVVAELVVQPAAELTEQLAVEVEPMLVDALDAEHAADRGGADSEPGGEQVGQGDPVEFDAPATIAGSIEQPPSGDAG